MACCRENENLAKHKGDPKPDDTQPKEECTEEQKSPPVNDGPTRGGFCNAVNKEKINNFFMVFGCGVDKGIKADSKMVNDVVEIMLSRYCKNTFTLDLLKCFDSIQGSDANFEVASSATIQPCFLHYSHNVITASHTVIFVTTNVKGLKYDGAMERAELQRKLWKDHLEVETVEILIDLSLEEFHDKLKALQAKGDEFGKKHAETKNFQMISIVFIGFVLNC